VWLRHRKQFQCNNLNLEATASRRPRAEKIKVMVLGEHEPQSRTDIILSFEANIPVLC
jgi:hypothetical protein